MILSQPGGPVAAAGLSVNCGKLSLACFGAPARGLQQRHLQKVFMTSAAVVDRLLWRLFSREAGHTEQIADTRYKIQDGKQQTGSKDGGFCAFNWKLSTLLLALLVAALSSLLLRHMWQDFKDLHPSFRHLDILRLSTCK